MNKQEAIKELESHKMIGTDARSACYNEAIKAGILVIKKLDEPQKQVVPKFVAEYLNYCMANEWTLGEALTTGKFQFPEYLYKAVDWLNDSMNQNIFAQAWLFGYEVEKEPLWAIKNADGNYLTKCDLWGKDGVNYSFECIPSYRLIFTDKEKADAAALLVNGIVEEVAEG
ncbi:DUF1642 domain-containing protein [Enterococcus hirae]|uniref:DUF1642 domain-containing protein n=1 Tax=Enterococcus hirae TaxID=1354 RepID=UPI003982C7C8